MSSLGKGIKDFKKEVKTPTARIRTIHLASTAGHGGTGVGQQDLYRLGSNICQSFENCKTAIKRISSDTRAGPGPYRLLSTSPSRT
jgi:hypothetical protein